MRRPFQWLASSEAIQTAGGCIASGWMRASVVAPSGGMTIFVAGGAARGQHVWR